jgi:chromosome segregation ATPase
MQALRTANQSAQEAVDSAHAQAYALQRELDSRTAECAGLSGQLAETQAALRVAHADAEEARRNISVLKQSISMSAEQLAAAAKALETARQESAQLTGQLQEERRQGGNHASAAKEAEDELQAVRGLLRVVRTQLEETGCGYVSAIPNTDAAWGKGGLEGTAQAVLIALPSHLQVASPICVATALLLHKMHFALARLTVTCKCSQA